MQITAADKIHPAFFLFHFHILISFKNVLHYPVPTRLPKLKQKYKKLLKCVETLEKYKYFSSGKPIIN